MEKRINITVSGDISDEEAISKVSQIVNGGYPNDNSVLFAFNDGIHVTANRTRKGNRTFRVIR